MIYQYRRTYTDPYGNTTDLLEEYTELQQEFHYRKGMICNYHFVFVQVIIK